MDALAMTRENKLALVVGFGLILFVGILISDHFSTVHTQRAADFTRAEIDDPLSGHAGDPQLIDLRPPPAQPQPAVSPTTIDASSPNPIATDGPQSEQSSPSEIRMVSGPESEPPLPPGFVAESDAGESSSNAKFHEVRAGESFFSICRQHYNDTRLAKALARFNGIDDPTALKIGRRLAIPSAQELGGGPPTSVAPVVSASANPTTAPALRVIREATTTVALAQKSAVSTYKVRAGDSLRQIAQRFLGSKSKWKKLHDLNRSIIDDPDNLKVGTVLRLL